MGRLSQVRFSPTNDGAYRVLGVADRLEVHPVYPAAVVSWFPIYHNVVRLEAGRDPLVLASPTTLAAAFAFVRDHAAALEAAARRRRAAPARPRPRGTAVSYRARCGFGA